MQQRIFHINAEVRPLTAVVLDPKVIAGAIVRCLVPAETSDNALSILAKQMAACGLELSGTEWCVDFDATEWENSGDTSEKDLAEHARKTGTVQFGDFHTWGHDAPDAH